MARTSLRNCGTCKARIIWARTTAGARQALDYLPNESGNIAAHQTAAGTWHARTLTPAEQPIPPEKRYTCHWVTNPGCKPLTDRQRAQRADAVTAVRKVLRTIRTDRAANQTTLF